MSQIIQLVGAVLILVAFAAAQFRLMDQRSLSYLILNLVGSAILAANAYTESQWGFVLLETIWAIVSAWSLFRLRAGRSATS